MLRSPLSRLTPLWIACALAAAASGEAAQKPAGPVAWVVNFQYGVGNLSMAGDGREQAQPPSDSLGRDFGRSMHLRLGHIVDRGVVVGFDARSWNDTGTDTLRGTTAGATDLTRHVQILTMTATLPISRGTYVRGGGGICKVRQEFLSHDPLGGASIAKTNEDVGFAVTAAGGWEYKLRPRLGAALDLEYARIVADHVGGNLLTYTAGLNYYW